MNTTILIVDDDDILRRAIATGLQAEGFACITADSAEQANEILGKISVDAIILDRMMGGTDGLTFLRSRREQGDVTPTIMLTAMTGPENAIAGLAGGADDYLAKPFQMRELVLRLNNIVRKHRTMPTPMPRGLLFVDDEFFVQTGTDTPRLLALSGEEKKLLQYLTAPVGNIAPTAPMVAKRLRTKLNSVLSNMDIITIRGRGYKLIERTPAADNKDTI